MAREWGRISSGETFESMASVLVYFEDQNAALFGRRGKDGGQDVRSGDRTLVYQAKHHANGTAAQAIADAKKEAGKIAEYRQPGNARAAQWQDVTWWRLVTNVPFNPTDLQRWTDEVRPLFEKLGLEADYWAQANLDALLAKHPEVDRAYFENETRCFLTIPEVRSAAMPTEPFRERGSFAPFVGRAEAVAGFRNFLASNALFLKVHGPGGIGKTRLLLEAGDEIASSGDWQVLWANVASMEATGSWFDAVIPERQTLLVVDEPETADLLKVLVEQTAGRMKAWKIVVAVRSPKDPVLKFLESPRLKARVCELALAGLPAEAAIEMCVGLLGSGPLAGHPEDWKGQAARVLSERFSRHPIWLSLAVHVLEAHGDLAQVPTEAEGLADEYLREILAQQDQVPKEKLRELLRWIALLGKINREDESSIKLLSANSEIGGEAAVKKILASLVSRRALRESGARNRNVEIQPDIMRDHILLRWLTDDVGFGDHPLQPSGAAEELIRSAVEAVKQGVTGPLLTACLRSLARTDLILEATGRSVPLLDRLFDSIMGELHVLPASKRILLAELITEIADVRPERTVQLSCALRANEAEDEEVDYLFGKHTVGQGDVVLSLPWMVYHAAIGARSDPAQMSVTRELWELIGAEKEAEPKFPRGLPNDGKRASGLIAKIISGGPQFWSDFGEATQAIADLALAMITAEPLTAAQTRMIETVLSAATSAERERTWAEGWSIQIQRYFLVPGDPAWDTRHSILDRAHQLLEVGASPDAAKSLLWGILCSAHTSALRASGMAREMGNGAETEYLDELKADLGWAIKALTSRPVGIKELEAARDLWEWHFRYDKEGERNALATKLEDLYRSNDLAREFAPLIDIDYWLEARGADDLNQRIQKATDAREAAVKGKAMELAASREAITAFIERAVKFLGGEKEIGKVGNVAWELGKLASEIATVRDFINIALASPEQQGAAYHFGLVGSLAWIQDVRRGPEPETAISTIQTLLARCPSDKDRAYLLRRLYGESPPFPHPRIPGMSPSEIEYVRSLGQYFLDNGQGPAFLQAVGWTHWFEWEQLRLLVDDAYAKIPLEMKGEAFNALADSIFWGLREDRDAHPVAPPDLGPWLLEKLIELPEQDDANNRVDWELGEIMKVTERPRLPWLASALRRRREIEEASGGRISASDAKALGKHVAPLTKPDTDDPLIQEAVSDLLELSSSEGVLAFYIPEIFKQVDPAGLIVPQQVSRKLSQAGADPDEAWRFARIGGVYAIGSMPWRAIARQAVVTSRTFGDRDRRSIFGSLIPSHKSWSSGIGEVPELFIRNAAMAQKFLEEEQDSELVPFWRWYLELTNTELRNQEESAKEDRGE